MMQQIRTTILRRLILPAGDSLYGQKLLDRLSYLERAQWFDRARVQEEQRRALLALVQTAYVEVPFYRELINRAGVRPSDISGPADLPKLPVVTKAMLRAAGNRAVRNTRQKTYDACSSGSTGEPFSIKEDSGTAGWYRACFLLALEWAGWQIGAPHLQTGMTLNRPRGRRLKDFFLSCHYASAYDLSDEQLDRNLDAIERHRLRFMWGYPASVYLTARRALEVKRELTLDALATWGDNLYPHYREVIERAFKARVYDQYGCGEGIMIAAQCGHGQTYHVFDPYVVVEYLDEQNQPVPPGTMGRIVLTRLHPGPTPLIRYAVGDIGVGGGSRSCTCGRGFSVMECINGRDTDIVVTPDGNRLIVHFFTGILEYFKEIDSFQVIQREPDTITLRIVPQPSFSEDTRHRIVTALRDKGANLDIRIELVSAIPVSASGKRRFVISEIKSGESAARKAAR